MSHFGNERLKTAPYIDMYNVCLSLFEKPYICLNLEVYLISSHLGEKKKKKKNEKEKGSLKCNGSCN